MSSHRDREATASSIADICGPGTPMMERALERLSGLYDLVDSARPVVVARQEWERYLAKSAPRDSPATETFLAHTYFALLCRLVSALSLGALPARPRPQDLWEVVSGDHFVREEISNFLGEDFFTWPFFQLSLGGQPPKYEDPALAIFREWYDSLVELDYSGAAAGLLGQIYRTGRRTDRPASGPAAQADRSLFEPDCGDGGSLAEGVSLAVSEGLADGSHPIDVLVEIPNSFMGMTTDPLAMTVARTNYLLALGGLLRGPHPPVLIPVYLADAAVVPPCQSGTDGGPVYTIADAGGIALPGQVACDPLYLDWLLDRLGNYLRGAALRLRAQREEVAVQEVLNAYYNYLVAPKARTPIPEPLTPAAADVMVEAARQLIQEYIHGAGHVPVFLTRNAPAPLFASWREAEAAQS